MDNWTKFFCDTNARWGNVDSREDWNGFLVDFGAGHDLSVQEAEKFLLKNARSILYIKGPHEGERWNFGLYAEHRGRKTLGQFFEENGMEPSYEPESELDNGHPTEIN